MTQPSIRICLIGQKFMGRAHSNAYLKVDKFFDLAALPVMHTVCGRNLEELEKFKSRWGWHDASADWESVISNPEIDLVDITTPNNQHLDMALAAPKPLPGC